MKQISTNNTSCPRRAVAEETAICDPVYLFQVRRVIYFVGCSGFEWPEGWSVGDDGLLCDGDDVPIDDDDALEHDCAAFYWVTEIVFATEQEAREHGEARPRTWGSEGRGWRACAVPCRGALAEMLVVHG